MGLLDWFTGGKQPDAAAAASDGRQNERSGEVAGLNFKSAVDAHMKWKIRLDAYISGTGDEKLDAAVVCRDDQCPLGKWIYGRGGGEFGYSETFFDMKAHHAHFHRCAGDIVLAAQTGDKEKAHHLLHHGDYVHASERVKKLLARLFVLVSDGKTAIDAHVKWKERLQDYIQGHSDEDLLIESVARADQCALGVWLDGEGKQHHGGQPAFENVRRLHAHFHVCAGKVLAVAQSDRRPEALTMLEEGEYAMASDEVTVALVDLFSERRQ
jgi:hypothetical protein